jgi:signal transduction histidine kinase
MNLATSRFGGLGPVAHVCFPYESEAERLTAVVQFVREGLSGNERCLFIGSSAEHEELLGALRAEGVSVDRAVARRALVLATQRETYLRTGRFDADDSLAMLDEHLEAARADGFVGFRGTGEASGTVPDELWPEINRYESLINERFARRPFVALCRFDAAQIPAERLRDVLRMHPQALVRGEPCDNPYYERAELALGGDSRTRLDWQLHQLRTHQRARRRLEDMVAAAIDLSADLAHERGEADDLRDSVQARDRFLSTLADELGDPLFALKREVHAMGVHAGGLGETPAPERLETASRHLRRLGAAVEHVRDVARLLGQTPRPSGGDCDLVEVVREAARRHAEGGPDGDPAAGQIEIVSTEPVRGRWDRDGVRRLVSALAADALLRAGGGSVAIAVDGDATHARLRFADGPEQRRGGERAAGLSLPLARELVAAAGGRLVPEGLRPDGLTSSYVVELPRRPPQAPS